MGCCYFENKEEKYELPLDFFDKIDDEKEPTLILENDNEVALIDSRMNQNEQGPKIKEKEPIRFSY